MNDYENRPVLVTGAAGFIGRWVCRELTRAGANLRMIVRRADQLETVADDYGIRGRIHVADLASRGSFGEAFRVGQPAVVFNLAGYGVDPNERDDELMWRLNVGLVEEILEAIEAAPADDGWTGARLVHAGSAFEYGLLQGRIDEKARPEPENAYGKSKLEATRRVVEASGERGLRAVSARLATVYGPGDHGHRLLPSLLRAAEQQEALKLTGGKQERDFTFVGDVVEGMLRLGSLTAGIPPLANLATGTLVSVREFVEAARDELELDPELLLLGLLPYREDEVWQGPLDVTLLERVLDWLPQTGPREGIAATRDFTPGAGGSES